MSIYINRYSGSNYDYHYALLKSNSSDGQVWLQKCIYRDSEGKMCLASPNIFCSEYTNQYNPERNRRVFQPSSVRCHEDEFCLSNEGTMFAYFRDATHPNMSAQSWIGYAMYIKGTNSIGLYDKTAVLDYLNDLDYFAVSPINASDDSIYLSTMEFIKPTVRATYNGSEGVITPDDPINAYEIVLGRPNITDRVPDDYNDWYPTYSSGWSYSYLSLRYIVSAPSDWSEDNFTCLPPYMPDQATTASLRYSMKDQRISYPTRIYQSSKKIKDTKYTNKTFWQLDTFCVLGRLASSDPKYLHVYLPYVKVNHPPSSGELTIHDMHMTIRLTDSSRSAAT